MTAPARYRREPDDWYQEPAWAVEALLDVEQFPGWIYDPACGGGVILAACQRRGLEAYGSDLVDRGCDAALLDFLAGDVPAWKAGSIVTNPPYRSAEEFVLRSLRVAEHRVAVLVRTAFLEGSARYQRLFRPHPPARIWQFCRRVSMPPAGRGVPVGNGTTAFCWMVWDVGAFPARPQLGWLE